MSDPPEPHKLDYASNETRDNQEVDDFWLVNAGQKEEEPELSSESIVRLFVVLLLVVLIARWMWLVK